MGCYYGPIPVKTATTLGGPPRRFGVGVHLGVDLIGSRPLLIPRAQLNHAITYPRAHLAWAVCGAFALVHAAAAVPKRAFLLVVANLQDNAPDWLGGLRADALLLQPLDHNTSGQWVWGLGFGVWGLGFRVLGLGFRA